MYLFQQYQMSSTLTLSSVQLMFACPDDEDEYIGSLSLCSIDEDHDENCDVTAIDRFHGLRVAHPVEAHRMGQGITVGRDASCGLVVDDPSVGGK